ncbi:hypothetical protein LIER_19458 [Lithospermum erythrorhizon]|uniref:Uncharacterized protein n=1 Tax=Lithospermum erythrorhizon TaxID=34254 RepID=A0AAV3QIP9_LITER
MGDLRFTPNHDLFANMEIPQKVVENISRTLNDAPEGDSLPYTEVLSVQPLAVRNPDTAQANQASNLPTTPAAPTSTSGAGTSQPGSSAVNTGDPSSVDPAVLRKSLPVPFSIEDLDNFREYFSIPPSVEMRLPDEEDMNVSHSGWLTSFLSKRNWNIFADPKIDKIVEDLWHSKWCFVKGGMDDAVRKVWVLLRNAKHPARAKKRSTTVRAQLETLRVVFDRLLHYKVFCEEGKRLTPEGGRPKEFSPRKKHVAHKPKRVEHVTISEDPPSASSHPPPVPLDNVGPPSPASLQEIPIFSSSSLLEDGADFGPKARVEYSSSLLNLPYTLPSGLLVTEDSTLWKKDSRPKAHVEYSSRTFILE